MGTLLIDMTRALLSRSSITSVISLSSGAQHEMSIFREMLKAARVASLEI